MKTFYGILVLLLILAVPAMADIKVLESAEGVTSGTQAVAPGETRTFDLSNLTVKPSPVSPVVLKIDVASTGKVNILPATSATAPATMLLPATTGLVSKIAETFYLRVTKRYLRVFSSNGTSSVTISRVN